ncbi:MAG TPA: DUF5694 domain-containing protein [Gemmatimonadaceae bacterium]|nr:DUF5694 domain-containing protein [Gemmatimonadaceae bacterium]
MKLARTARVAAALATVACTTGTATGPGPSPFTAIPAGFPASCAADQVQVMLLGTYHFAGSSSDATRTDPDDVLAPRLQAEIEDLVSRLARWNPEQIAVEWPFSFTDSTRARYARFRAGILAPSRNEVVQVGFRLADRLGHEAVYPVDMQMRLGNDSLAELMERRPDLQRHSDSLRGVLQSRADSGAVRMGSATIVEILREANSEEALHGGNSLGMFGSFIAAGEGGNYGGPQLLARWYERNIVMVHHITRVLKPDTRRVLVLVGSGHVPAMRNILDESPQFCPVSPLPLLQ